MNQPKPKQLKLELPGGGQPINRTRHLMIRRDRGMQMLRNVLRRARDAKDDSDYLWIEIDDETYEDIRRQVGKQNEKQLSIVLESEGERNNTDIVQLCFNGRVVGYAREHVLETLVSAALEGRLIVAPKAEDIKSEGL